MLTGLAAHAVAMTINDIQTGERADILETLAKHRGFLRQTVQGLNDEQARLRPTASELCLGGLIKHVARVEESWSEFIVAGPARQEPPDEATYAAHAAGFRMEDDETLEMLVAAYDEVAARTDRLVSSLPSLGRVPATPRGPLVPARCPLVSPPGVAPHHRRVRSARRSRRHPPGVHRRSEDDGLTALLASCQTSIAASGPRGAMETMIFAPVEYSRCAQADRVTNN